MKARHLSFGMSPRRRGFTLVELLVVITIIALLLGLLVVLIRGIVDRARNAKTAAIVKMLDMGCNAYHTETGSWPPNDLGSSASLHKHLGAEREVVVQYVASGTAPKVRKPPIIEFKVDQLEGDSTSSLPDPPRRVIDAWGNAIRYANPGVHNPKGVDIWSPGKDGKDDPAGTEDSDDISNWVKDF